MQLAKGIHKKLWHCIHTCAHADAAIYDVEVFELNLGWLVVSGRWGDQPTRAVRGSDRNVI